MRPRLKDHITGGLLAIPIAVVLSIGVWLVWLKTEVPATTIRDVERLEVLFHRTCTYARREQIDAILAICHEHQH